MELARGDGARVRELLADALTTADALGMVAVAERARGLLSANAVVAPASVDVGE